MKENVAVEQKNKYNEHGNVEIKTNKLTNTKNYRDIKRMKMLGKKK